MSTKALIRLPGLEQSVQYTLDFLLPSYNLGSNYQ